MTDSKVARYQLGVSAAALLTLLLATFALFFHAGGVAENVENNTKTISTLTAIFSDHRGELGHIGMVERVAGMADDIGEVKEGVQRIEQKLDSQ